MYVINSDSISGVNNITATQNSTGETIVLTCSSDIPLGTTTLTLSTEKTSMYLNIQNGTSKPITISYYTTSASRETKTLSVGFNSQVAFWLYHSDVSDPYDIIFTSTVESVTVQAISV